MTSPRYLRAAILISIVVVNFVVMALSARNLDLSRQQHELQAKTLTQNLAVALDHNVSNRVQKIDLTLLTVVDELERQLKGKGLDTAAVTSMLSRHEQRVPEVEAFRIADENGSVILGKGVNPKEPASWADRDYFLFLREHANGGLQISKPRVGRVAKQYIIGFARRYNYPDGRFAGVVSAPIALEHFTNLLTELELGSSGTLILRDADLGLITRLPRIPGQAVGAVGNTDVSNEFRNLAQSGTKTSTYYLQNSPDGFERILTFRRMQGAPMIVIAGTASNDYLEGWYQERNRAIGIVIGFLLFSGLVGAFLLRLLAQSERDQLQMQESETRLRAIIENEPECIKVVNEQGQLIQMNPAGLAMIQATAAEQVIGQPVIDVIAPEYREAFAEMHRRVIAGESMQMEFEVQGLQGGRRLLETHAVPMHDHGSVVHLAVTRDISERKAYENELKHAKKAADAANIAKSQFLATMSHEIRTPMNGILGMAQTLLSANITESDRQDYARTIVSSGQTLLALLNDILDLSKVEAGKIELELGAFGPDQIVQESVILFAEAAQAKSIGLEGHWSGPPKQRYMGDAMRLRQMLTNLIGNALKFTSQGKVSIEATETERDEKGALLEFIVTDTGIGIDQESLAHLFKPFSQADSSTTRQFGGTGLGLSIVSSLAKLMGGDVGVDSTPGKGSRFWLRVRVGLVAPEFESRQSDRDSSGVANPKASPLTMSGHVLVVEDNLINQNVAKVILGRLGLTCTIAKNGQEGLDAIVGGDQADLILMDLQMPVMDGFVAAQQIRLWESTQGQGHRPIIALTADAFDDVRQRCLEAGMDDFLTKPIDINTLTAKVERWLGQSQIDSANAQVARTATEHH
jgi:PAS domain S-box-containing protein